MKDTIKVKTNNGEIKEAEVLLFFKLEEGGKDYIIYTFDEKIEDDIILHASQLVDNNGEYELNDITTDEEWEQIKDVMREIAVEK